MQEKTPGGKESLSPRQEWEKAKNLVATLYDSGATRLLWQLSEYINSDPKLSEPVRKKRIILRNEIKLITEEALSIALSDESAKYFIEDTDATEGYFIKDTEDNTKFKPFRGYSGLIAFSTLLYNPDPLEKVAPICNYLFAECYEEDIVTVSSGSCLFTVSQLPPSFARFRIKISNALKNTEAVDYALGELYQKRPALPYNLRRSDPNQY